MTKTFRIRSLSSEEALGAAPALAAVLLDCVQGGASVSFMAGMTLEEAEAFWRRQAEAGDGRTIIVAEDDEGVFGVVQVVPAWAPNQPHHAEVLKLLVHRRGRQRGAAEALMRATEDTARQMRRSLLTLDTVTGSVADDLYDKLGWTRVGVIPDYALWPDGGLCDATFFYKAVHP
ncbi:MAG TPA: GNAT family N-acetyltransferase [Phenylobacterium sp.]|jgi:GNAT superfamily N-acetyltransferase|nr:GNAT family N-acetyltransferase [Phenylobacterium sp.]